MRGLRILAATPALLRFKCSLVPRAYHAQRRKPGKELIPKFPSPAPAGDKGTLEAQQGQDGGKGVKQVPFGSASFSVLPGTTFSFAILS